MDQDSFRQLLQTPRVPGATPQLKGAHGASLLKQKASGSSAPTFKPRKVKKNESKYRDRAAERRDGGKSDYAQVEAVLEDFEQRTANNDKDTVDEQRQYLGGDSEHTILVKGLDVSLLEQNKARAAAATEDDDTLEQAFIEASSKPTTHKKRTREDIIRELKAKRNGEGLHTTAEPLEDGDRELEKAKKAGKFKPIGFKPIGAQKDEKGTKKRSKEETASRDKKRKKRKVEGISGSPQPANTVPHPEAKPPVVASTSVAELIPLVDQRPSSPLDDIDIFAGAGDYEGFLGDDDSDEDGLDSAHKTESEHRNNDPHPLSEHARSRGWFGDEHDDEGSMQLPASTESDVPQLPISHQTPQVDEEEEESLRLKPLESSALPSIRDFLAMDAAAEKEDKRKARKEKRKTKKKSGGDDDD